MGDKRCGKGKPCGATCISRDKICVLELGPQFKPILSEVSSKVKEEEAKPKISKESKKAAADAIRKYQEGEPATTALLQRLAKQTGSELVGLKNKLKTEESLARKIEKEKGNFGGDAVKTANSMSDINRYTLQLPAGKYGDVAKKVLSELAAEGYSARIKNYWTPGGPYRGINIALTSRDGRVIELQLHTKDSLEAKSRTHGLYETFRVSDDKVKKKEIWDEMIKISSSIPMPKGAMGIGGKESIKRVNFNP